jgi:DNA-binding XRE family transcriptional regulator
MLKMFTVKAPIHFHPVKIDAATMNNTLSRIYSKRGVRTLGHLRKAFSLTRTDVARLFRVTPEAVLKWERNGVPVQRLAEIDRCFQLAEMMQHRLRPDRLPALVRTPAADFNNRTVLEMIAENGTQAVYDYMRRIASGLPR